MSKLQNVKAIKNMLSGTHKSQTRQTHYDGKTSNEMSVSPFDFSKYSVTFIVKNYNK